VSVLLSSAVGRLFPIIVLLLAAPARADRVDDLGKALAGDSNWKVRMQAASVLGRLHDKRGVPALVRALSDSSEAVRGVAAGALGEIGDPSASAALKRSLRDPSQLVRDQAQAALDALPAPPPTVASSESRPAQHSEPPNHGGVRVEIGAITSRTSRLPGDLSGRLRAKVEKNLRETAGVSYAPSGAQYTLDTSVTKLTRRTSADAVEIDCEVSLILSRSQGKAIVLTTSGGATSKVPRAVYTPESDKGMIIDALEGAVTGAWSNLAAFFNKTSARR
jgi:hypothetical protein